MESLTLQETAARLGVSSSHVGNLRKRGYLSARTYNGRLVFQADEVWRLGRRGWPGRQVPSRSHKKVVHVRVSEGTLAVAQRVAERSGNSRNRVLSAAIEAGLAEAAKRYGVPEVTAIVRPGEWPPREQEDGGLNP